MSLRNIVGVPGPPQTPIPCSAHTHGAPVAGPRVISKGLRFPEPPRLQAAWDMQACMLGQGLSSTNGALTFPV